VADFDTSKQSFIFTHIHDVRDICPNNRIFANRCLQNETLRSVEGNRDDDVRQILRFLTKYLRKNYPFVQVYHLLTADYTRLERTITEKMRKADPAYLARNCGFTIASKLVDCW